MRLWPTIVLLLAAVVAKTNGSAIQFNTTANPIRPPLTTNLVLRCSLHDTTPNVSGGLVGRRKRGVQTSPPHVDNAYKTTNIQKVENRRQSVTNTTANVPFMTSVVISKDGMDIARISEHFPASPVVSSHGLSVTGNLSSQAGERGFLQVSWRHPTTEQTGKYSCDVDSLDTQGQPVDFSTSLEIREEEISLSDMIYYVQKIQNDKDDMKATTEAQQKEITNLKQTTALLGSLVFFSAAATTGGSNFDVPFGTVLVFDNILSSMGGGYDNSSGVFTCPLTGVYFFTVNLETSASAKVDFHLKHNDQEVLTIYSSSGHDNQGVTNSVNLRLQLGDTVRVVSDGASQIWAYSVAISTFSGHLLAAV